MQNQINSSVTKLMLSQFYNMVDGNLPNIALFDLYN